MRFRIAAANDAKSIAELHAQSWKRTYRGMMPNAFLDGPVVAERLVTWRERLSREHADRRVFVAEEDDQLAGFIYVLGAEDPIWGSYIDNLHVSGAFRRRGVGSALMSRAATWLERDYATVGVYLWVMEANTAARLFYERLGASSVGTVTKPDPGGGSAPNCRYTWKSATALLGAIGRARAS